MAGGGGSGVVELTKGVNWIGLMQDAAPPTLGPNAKLGINGVLYTYGDGCATISWDPISRCISGELCLASAANWGVSVGFDLFNTGDMGTPPIPSTRGMRPRSVSSASLGKPTACSRTRPNFGFRTWIPSTMVNAPQPNAGSTGHLMDSDRHPKRVRCCSAA